MYSTNYIVNKNIPNKLYNFIVFSIVIHLIVILGLSIKWYTNIRQSTKAIDITLVTNKSSTKPKKADFMAQADQQGGGESYKKNKPSTDQNSIYPDKPY